MSQPRVTELRHIGVAVPDFDKQVAFYQDVWGLSKVATDGDIAYFATEGSPEQYVLRIRKSLERRVDLLALGMPDVAGVDQLAERLAADGVQLISQPGKLQTPGGGYGLRFFDPDGRTVEVSAGVQERQWRVLEYRESIPAQLSHLVFNSPNPQQCIEFYQEKLGMKLSGWLGDFFGFLRCRPDFHNLAFVKSANANLHHVSFELRGYDEYLRGVGRVLKAGTPMPWGIGKHTPADSGFAYFID
ncbi:MAG: VOC family protein, partial [Chloroflexi bacterium]|nr:VOC family protein [Chloroflexota bacterium]